MTLQDAGQQHTHTEKVVYSSMAPQKDQLSRCNETPSIIAADLQTSNNRNSSQEGAEMVTTLTAGTTFIGYGTSAHYLSN